MARSYPYGKVPGSVGTVISERFESPMVCCGYASAQFAARDVKPEVGNLCRNSGHKIRAAGGRKHNAGSTALEQRRGLDRALGVKVVGIRRSEILGRVRAGYAVTVTISYEKLPDYLKVQGNAFYHCVTFKGHRLDSDRHNQVGFFDPLWLQGSQGTWARWIDVREAIHETGHNTTTTKR